MLQVFVDDSKTAEDILVLGGYIGHPVKWAQFSAQWRSLLQESPAWGEFKMARAANYPQRALKFHKVVQEHVAAYVVCAVEIKPLRKLCDELVLPDFFRNPYNWALKALPGAIYQQLGEVGSQYPLEFIFDARGEEKYLQDGWPFFVLGVPERARNLIAAGPRFAKSHEVPPLQAAEIIAWHARRHWLKHKHFGRDIDLSWPHAAHVPGLCTLWDYQALRPNLVSIRNRLVAEGNPLAKTVR